MLFNNYNFFNTCITVCLPLNLNYNAEFIIPSIKILLYYYNIGNTREILEITYIRVFIHIYVFFLYTGRIYVLNMQYIRICTRIKKITRFYLIIYFTRIYVLFNTCYLIVHIICMLYKFYSSSSSSSYNCCKRLFF